MSGEPSGDDPALLAHRVAHSARTPLLVGLDIDGVLSPIVDHAPDARLLPGMLDDVVALSECTPVAVVSGRNLESIDELFAFPDHVIVVGTHGAQRRGRLTEFAGAEAERLSQFTELVERAAQRAGEGAWVEHKSLSVALHTRRAAPGRSAEATAWLAHAFEQFDGGMLKSGQGVVELMARPASKAAAVVELRHELGAKTALFVGDDATDEEVFASFGPDDWPVRVGPGPTVARHRLADPVAVQHFLRHLTDRLQHI
ncbi:hypothetical protein BH18ACT3_BH18ACT3_07000 [soil metagenome]